jgi:hypothetical protein
MIDQSLPYFRQLRALVQPSELQGLANDLTVTIPALTRLTVETIPFMRDQVRPASTCAVNVIHPWTELTVRDPHFNSKNGFPPRKVYVEGVDFLPGLAGESRDFDANGPYVRVLGTGGTFTYSLQPGLFGQALAPITGVQPEVPPHGNNPPLESGVPCETQPKIATLATPSGSGPQQVHAPDTPAIQKLEQSLAPGALSQLKALLRQQSLGLLPGASNGTKK